MILSCLHLGHLKTQPTILTHGSQAKHKHTHTHTQKSTKALCSQGWPTTLENPDKQTLGKPSVQLSPKHLAGKKLLGVSQGDAPPVCSGLPVIGTLEVFEGDWAAWMMVVQRWQGLIPGFWRYQQKHSLRSWSRLAAYFHQVCKSSDHLFFGSGSW